MIRFIIFKVLRHHQFKNNLISSEYLETTNVEKGTSFTLVGMLSYSIYMESNRNFSKKVRIALPYKPLVLHFYVYNKKKNIIKSIGYILPILILVIGTIAKIQK